MFDSHAHYDDKAFNADRDEIIKLVHHSGIEYIVNAGSDIITSRLSVELAQRFEFIYSAVGIHPHEAKMAPKDYINTIEKLSQHSKVVAIGEIGLDYHYDFSPRTVQRQIFAQQIDLSKKLNLPIIVHDREAHEDIMDILKSEGQKRLNGVMHCFSGSFEMAKEVIKQGLFIGIGGSITFSNARKIVEVVEKIPIEYMLSETDCPYLTPVPFRGKRNDSRYIKYVIEKIAQIKKMEFDEVDKILSDNAKKLFGI